MADITTLDLTTGAVDGSGVFDLLMKATKAHLDQEFEANRIRGNDYATVYLGSVQAVMQTATQFLLEKDRAARQAELLQAQIDSELLNQQLTQANIAQTEAQTGLITQQTANAEAEGLNIPKQGLVLDGQKCKLDAEFDVLLEQKLKTVAETALLNQRKVTEQAQTVGAGVDEDSVIGRQKALHKAQADGFLRDAEQKAAKIMLDTWNVRRTTDEATQANTDNRLTDVHIGQVIDKLMAGVNA